MLTPNEISILIWLGAHLLGMAIYSIVITKKEQEKFPWK